MKYIFLFLLVGFLIGGVSLHVMNTMESDTRKRDIKHVVAQALLFSCLLWAVLYVHFGGSFDNGASHTAEEITLDKIPEAEIGN